MESMVNALEIPETANQAQDISILENKPFTKLPNEWTDDLRFDFDRTVRPTVECVMRNTLGYHRTEAEITTQEFADYIGVSIAKAKQAKRQAIDIGVIVRIKKGTGGNPSIYGINLDYDRERAKTLPGASKKQKRIPRSPAQEKAKIFYLPGQKSQQPQDFESPKTPEPKKAENVENKGKTNRSESSRSYRGSKKDQDQDKETNKNVTGDSESSGDSEKRKKLEDVCSLLRKLGFETTERDRGFLKRMIARFGLEKILEKIKIMKSQIARNIVIRNFCGWLRSAVNLDFQPYDADARKIEADAARERSYEKGRLEAQKRADEDQKLLDAREDDPEMRNRINATLAAAGFAPLPV